MDTYQLCDSEYRFMQVVWDAAPVASGRLVELCAAALGWKKSTTYTVLRKLCEKGLLKNEDALVTVLVPREAVTGGGGVSVCGSDLQRLTARLPDGVYVGKANFRPGGGGAQAAHRPAQGGVM